MLENKTVITTFKRCKNKLSFSSIKMTQVSEDADERKEQGAPTRNNTRSGLPILDVTSTVIIFVQTPKIDNVSVLLWNSCSSCSKFPTHSFKYHPFPWLFQHGEPSPGSLSAALSNSSSLTTIFSVKIIDTRNAVDINNTAMPLVVGSFTNLRNKAWQCTDALYFGS